MKNGPVLQGILHNWEPEGEMEKDVLHNSNVLAGNGLVTARSGGRERAKGRKLPRIGGAKPGDSRERLWIRCPS
jgi:hypothetical protein